jgi:hypothetical protein
MARAARIDFILDSSSSVLIALKLEAATDVFLKVEPILLQVAVSFELFIKRKRPALGGARSNAVRRSSSQAESSLTLATSVG